MPDRTDSSLARVSGRGHIWLAALVSALIFVAAHWSGFANPYAANDDARQQVFWMAQWQDPDLYAGDTLTDYAACYVTWGVTGVYRAFSLVMAPLTASKIIPGFLFVFLGCCLFRIGRVLGGPGRAGLGLAWAVTGVYWYMPFFLYTMSGGLSRAYAFPLMTLFCLAWLENRGWLMGAALLVMSLFIPYMFVLCGAATGLAWIAARVRLTTSPPFPSRVWHYALVILACALVVLFSRQLDASGYGPLTTKADMAGQAEFTAEGRDEVPVMPTPGLFTELVRPFERILPMENLGVFWGGAAILAALPLLLVGARRFAWKELKPHLRTFLFLCLASVIMFYAAKILLLKLFMPRRYVMFTANFLYCLGLGACVWGLASRWPKQVLAGLVLAAALVGVFRLKNEALYDYSGQAGLYEALQETPKDTLVAGHPYDMDNVLTFGRRPVLASYELAHPWSKGLWKDMKPKFFALFDAYYARDPEAVRAFGETYGVSLVLVREAYYTREFIRDIRRTGPFYEAADLPEFTHSICRALGLDWDMELPRDLGTLPHNRPFFEPFGQYVRGLAANATHFALLDKDEFPSVYEQDGLRLVRITR